MSSDTLCYHIMFELHCTTLSTKKSIDQKIVRRKFYYNYEYTYIDNKEYIAVYYSVGNTIGNNTATFT